MQLPTYCFDSYDAQTQGRAAGDWELFGTLLRVKDSHVLFSPNGEDVGDSLSLS